VEQAILRRIDANKGNRTSRDTILAMAREALSEAGLDEALATPGWRDYFIERHEVDMGFGVLSKGETKADIPPNFDESQTFVNTLSNMPEEDKEAIEGGWVLSTDEMGVPLFLLRTLSHFLTSHIGSFYFHKAKVCV
jgi:hypothetical protein